MADINRRPMGKRGAAEERKWLAPALVGAGTLVAIGFVVFVLRNSSTPSKPPPFIETMNVRVVPLPPPPPPPPPPPKKTLEEIKEKDLQQPSPEIPNQPKSPAKLAAPPGPLQTNGPLGNDSFGLGQGDGGGGGGGGGGGKGYGGFVTAVQEKLQVALSRDEKLRFGRYRVRLSLWISDDGRPQRCALVDSTGDSGMDSSFCRVAEAVAVYAPPPADHRGEAVTVRLIGARATG